MPASYPTSTKTFTTRNTGDTIASSHINDLQVEVAAVESDLLNPSPTFLATVTSGINAAALSTGTVSLSRLDANVLLTTSTTGINASALSTGTMSLDRLDANVILTTTTTGINASALSIGTVPLGQLDANVLLTTSTTGINASALSTGTVPLARLSSANTTANGAVDTTTQTFAGDKTFQNAASFSNTVSITGAANTLSTLGIGGTLNALGLLGVSGNATFGQDVVVTGNLTISGTTTYINTTNLQIGDNIIALNADLPSGNAPTENAGIEVNRGSSANTYLRWNEMGDVWEVTNDGTNYGTVIDTRSTTGVNASALSTGTLPDGRLSGAYTGVTSLALGANVVANVTTVFVGNSTANVSHTATSVSVANSTNTATLTATSLAIGGTIANTTALVVPATSKVYLDGGGDTYVTESSMDVMDLYAGGANTLRMNSSGAVVTGTLSASSTLAWGGGSAITSSSNVALLDAANTFTGATQTISASVPAWKALHTAATRGARFGQVLDARIDVSNNLWFDGANWNLDATGSDGWLWRGTSANPFVVEYATAGSNPRTLSSLFIVSSTGTLAWGGGSSISSSSNVALLASPGFTGTVTVGAGGTGFLNVTNTIGTGGPTISAFGGPAIGNYKSADSLDTAATRWTFGRDNQSTGNFVWALNTTQLMCISSAGYVGIGAASPSVALTVSGATNLASRAYFTNTYSADKTASIGGNRDTSDCPFVGSTTNHDFAFITNDTERMRLSSAGILKVSGATAAGADHYVYIDNATAAGSASLLLEAGANNGQLYTFGETYSTSGAYMASSTVLRAHGSGGLNLLASNGSGDVRIYSRNVLAATFGLDQTATFTSDLQIDSATSGSALLTIGPSSPGANGTGRLRFINSNTNVNWQISHNDTAGATFEIAPSTTGGGSTFTTPVFKLTTSGATFAGDVTLAATKKLYLDGGSDTYIYESSSNTVRGYAGGTFAWQFDSSIWYFQTEASIPATKKFYLDGGPAAGAGDTYITEAAANSIKIIAGNYNALEIDTDGIIAGINNWSGGWLALTGSLSGYAAKTYPTLKTNGNYIHFDAGGTYTGYIGYNTGFTDVSDARFKTNISTISNALAAVTQIRGVNFAWKDGRDDFQNHTGFIAQELQPIIPEAVVDNEGEGPDVLGVNDSALTPWIVEAVKELYAVVQQQQAEIDALKAQMKE